MSTMRNPKDSMKSTWRSADRSTWKHAHWVFERFNIYQINNKMDVPVHPKTDKMPYVPEWAAHRWIWAHAILPLAFHQGFMYYTGKELNFLACFIVYNIGFQISAIHQLHALRRLGHLYGFLDGDKHARDDVPDVGVSKVFTSLGITPIFRMLMSVWLSYDRTKTPLQLNWYALPFEIGLYGIVLDFWFYWYHRVMHDNDSLWKYHRTHHLTKHPNALLTLYADEEQEVFDICGIPLLAYGTLKLMGFPMGFYEWYICHMYVVFAELAGHSGLRIHSSPPSTMTWLLRYFGAELVIEDHDLHHRQGWKKSHNYGKQTRLWDKVFGTLGDRIETKYDNIDYDNPVAIPLFFESP